MGEEEKIAVLKKVLKNNSLMGLTEKEETIIKEEIKRTIYLYENYFGGNPQRPKYHHRKWY